MKPPKRLSTSTPSILESQRSEVQPHSAQAVCGKRASTAEGIPRAAVTSQGRTTRSRCVLRTSYWRKPVVSLLTQCRHAAQELPPPTSNFARRPTLTCCLSPHGSTPAATRNFHSRDTWACRGGCWWTITHRRRHDWLVCHTVRLVGT